MVLVKDTSSVAEKVQLELFKKASPAKRFALMSSFSRMLRQAAFKHLEQRLSPREARLEWARLHYGEAIVKQLRAKVWSARSTVNETEEALQELVSVFEVLAISYRIVGSVASSTQGMMRATLGVDMVAKLETLHIAPLVTLLKHHYHVDEALIKEAIERGSSFNLIHLATMIKIDIFMLGKRPYDRVSFERERLETLDGLTLSFKTPEDIILGKLEWFVQTDKTSERQWTDSLGLLKAQGSLLDFTYLRHWANELGMLELLEDAVQAAQI